MSKFKHTPGPWIKGKGNTITKSDGLKISLSMPSAAAPESSIEERVAADANLIASAPDLLEAAKLAMSSLLSTEKGYAECKAAIEKATLSLYAV